MGPRLISAAVLIAVIATALYFGGYVWAALAAVVFAGAYREWEQMVTLEPIAPLGMVLGGLVALAALVYPAFGPLGTVGGDRRGGDRVALFGERPALVWRVGGLIFFALVLIAVLAMRGTVPAGIVAGWYLGIVIASNDTGAYFVGRHDRRAKAGADDLAGQDLVRRARRLAARHDRRHDLLDGLHRLALVDRAAVLGGARASSGRLGDLSESAIKRLFRIKDSGDIIPGHGGLMDRLDSLTFGVIFLVAIGVAAWRLRQRRRRASSTGDPMRP